MTNEPDKRPGALTISQMREQLLAFPEYRASLEAPARQFEDVVRHLWGGVLTPMMASVQTRGRFASAPLSCPATACTGSLVLGPGAGSKAWRNIDAIECLVCIDGSAEVRFGPALDSRVELGKFDMLSMPANVRHTVSNVGTGSLRIVKVLSVPAGGTYAAVFDEAQSSAVPAAAQAALDLRFDSQPGAAADDALMSGRTTRFESLVPYKKDLNRTGGLPPEATASLSAGNVYPLIVPEGHIGRSRTAPMYGNQGLYISIAECRAGDDGPPPHAHSDTQESFYVLDGSFDICTGFDNESVVQAWPNDLFAAPPRVMRTFRNTSGKPARLLVIIQGPDRMQDTVSFARAVGEDFARRFGADIIGKYADIRMTFDAEDRLNA